MPHKLNPLIIGDMEVKIPIVQGAMGVKVSTASLASAVANCGCAGTIASVGLGFGSEDNDTDYLKASREGLLREIHSARKASSGVIGVNVMVALSNHEELAVTAASEDINFLASGAGLPLKLPQLVESRAIKLIPIVSSGRAADLIARTWKKRYDRIPDAFIVEGPLAGGHLGFKFDELTPPRENALEEYVKEVLEVASGYTHDSGRQIPVIAAGGIFNGKDIARFLRLGAQGVQMATRFVATHECSVADEFKKLYLEAGEEDVVIIQSPVGMPGRAIRTELIERVMKGGKVPFRCVYRCLKTCEPNKSPYCIAKALFDASEGHLKDAVVFTGSNVSRIDKIVSVKELVDELAEEAAHELALN
jgi:NAD(P)H-dependent flavin oxidoreductase YrpB (nitropropane dioxygenase family)